MNGKYSIIAIYSKASSDIVNFVSHGFAQLKFCTCSRLPVCGW